jgi:hypothetical protein
MKDFLDKLKKNNKYDCYFIPATQIFEGGINIVSGYDKDGYVIPNRDYDVATLGKTALVNDAAGIRSLKYREGNSHKFGLIDEKDLDNSLKSKKMIIIVMIRTSVSPIEYLLFKKDKTSIDYKKYKEIFNERKLSNYIIDICETIVHESVAHAIHHIDNNKKDSDYEHQDYHGDKGGQSPSIEKIKSNPKYKNTKAKKNLDFIIKYVNEFIKTKKL